MIEYYTLMHKGSENLYRDNFFMNFGSTITVLMLYVSKIPELILDAKLSSKLSSVISSCNGMDFKDINDSIESVLNNQCDFLLMQINDSSVLINRRGSIYINVVKNGELKSLPNGYFTLENDDHLVLGTGAFFKYLSNPAILSDALVSISSEEWMDYLSFRIAEQSGFAEGNITAVTFIVRKD